MTNLEFAKKELDYAGYKDNADTEENQYGKMVRDAVLELLETFEKQGHSGYSASVVSKIFMRLVDYKPLSPINSFIPSPKTSLYPPNLISPLSFTSIPLKTISENKGTLPSTIPLAN